MKGKACKKENGFERHWRNAEKKMQRSLAELFLEGEQ